MGTNYYIRENEVPYYTKRNDIYTLDHVKADEIHIGKHSYGWEFCFQSHPGKFTSYKEFKEYILKHNSKIYNEYGDSIDHVELLETIDSSRAKGNLSHYRMMLKDYPNSCASEYIDADEWSFTTQEFS